MYAVYVDLTERVRFMDRKSPEFFELRDISRKVEQEFFDLANAKPKQEYEIYKKRSEQIADIISSIRDLATPEQAQRQFNTRSMIKPLMSEVVPCYPAE